MLKNSIWYHGSSSLVYSFLFLIQFCLYMSTYQGKYAECLSTFYSTTEI